MHLAAAQGHVAALQVLDLAGADFNATTANTQCTRWGGGPFLAE